MRDGERMAAGAWPVMGAEFDEAVNGSETRGDEDVRLVARLAARDRDALVELYARYQRPLFGYLLRLAADRGLAEELLQDTLVAAWTSAASFAGRSSVRTWLFGIARRQAHNTLRRHYLPLAAAADADVALDETPDGDPGPEDRALAGADRSDMIDALSRLSPAHREVLVLALVQGMPQPELAAVLGTPLGTVKSRLHHAKAALRRALTAGKEEG